MLLSLIGAIWFSVSQAVAIRWFNKHGYNLNTASLVLGSELCKIAIAYTTCIWWFKKPGFPSSIQWGYSVVSFMYAITNICTYSILSKVDVGLYTIISQFKIIIVMILSKIVLTRTFTYTQWGASILLMIGIVLTEIETIQTPKVEDIDVLSIIFFQGLCSSFANVWIEKMMKSQKSQDNVLYEFLTDSIQMYLFGIPVYVVLYFVNVQEHSLPIAPTLTLVINGAGCGIFIGSIFKYYSAITRTFVQGVTIILCVVADVMLFTKEIKQMDLIGMAFVIVSIYLFVV